MTQVVVVTGGGELSARATSMVEPDALVIAADSGLDDALAADIAPTVLVGDLDSISASGTMWAYAHDVQIERHPEDKDATDTELALARAAASGRDHLLLLGGPGDRLDHTLGTLAALGAAPMAGFVAIRALLGDSELHIVHAGHSTTLPIPTGSPFSLIALHGACRGITVVGARWPLADADLPPGSARGISNETIDATHISIADGVLTVVIP